MSINIKATKTSLTPAIKTFIEDRIESLGNFIKQEDKIRVELEVDKKHHSGLIFRAEVDIQPHGHYAQANAEDFYVAFDMAVAKIKEQLIKRKGKKLSLRRSAKKRA